MTLCPIALAVGCQKCPVFKICPLTTVLGDVPSVVAGAPAPKAVAAPVPRAVGTPGRKTKSPVSRRPKRRRK
ncbi:MAG: hypothetical protein IPP07_09095 [Holophagales bacterium]|nr:hypothetical protein [Holophagales bacterium]